MPLVIADRVQETTNTTGTGTLTLAGASSGYRTFSSGIGNANTTYYAIVSGADWEVGLGTYTSSGNTLSRDTVLKSSAGGTTKISVASGATVFATYPGDKAVTVGSDTSFNTINFASISIPSTPASSTLTTFVESFAGKPMPAFICPSGVENIMQPHIARYGWLTIKPNFNSTVLSYFGQTGLSTSPATATAANYATTSLHTRLARIDYLQTSPSTTQTASYRTNPNTYRVTDGFHHIARVAPATGTTSLPSNRFFCGMSTSTTTPTDVDPGTLTNSVGVGYASGDTNWQIYFAGTANAKVDTGITKPSTDRSDPITVAIYAPPGGAYLGVKLINDATNASFESTTTTSTNIMSTTTAAGARAYHSVGGVSSVTGLTLFSLYVETEY